MKSHLEDNNGGYKWMLRLDKEKRNKENMTWNQWRLEKADNAANKEKDRLAHDS